MEAAARLKMFGFSDKKRVYRHVLDVGDGRTNKAAAKMKSQK